MPPCPIASLDAAAAEVGQAEFKLPPWDLPGSPLTRGPPPASPSAARRQGQESESAERRADNGAGCAAPAPALRWAAGWAGDGAASKGGMLPVDAVHSLGQAGRLWWGAERGAPRRGCQVRWGKGDTQSWWPGASGQHGCSTQAFTTRL